MKKPDADSDTLGIDPRRPEVTAFVREAQQAWPEIHIPIDDYLAFVSQRLGEGRKHDLQSLRAADLYLVCACLHGEPNAIRSLETYLLSQVPDLIARAQLDRKIDVDDFRQTLRQRLLVHRDGVAPSALANYAGRGDLRAWFRVVALRMALNCLRDGAKEVPTGDEALVRFAGSGSDAELNYLKQRYTELFRASFARALAQLSPRERNLLRMHYLDGVDLDTMAQTYRVHRVTVSRWLAKTRADLALAIRDDFDQQLGCNAAELRSLLRTIRSQLDLSLRRHLSEAVLESESTVSG